jgi:hypothetical protein
MLELENYFLKRKIVFFFKHKWEFFLLLKLVGVFNSDFIVGIVVVLSVKYKYDIFELEQALTKSNAKSNKSIK